METRNFGRVPLGVFAGSAAFVVATLAAIRLFGRLLWALGLVA